MQPLKFFIAAVAVFLAALSAGAAPSQSPDAPVHDVVDAEGRVRPGPYREVAGAMSEARGIAFRYGAPAAPGMAAVPTLATRPSQPFRCDDRGRNCLSSWEVGGPYAEDSGLYSTNQAQVLFVPAAGSPRVGVGDLQISAVDHNTFAQAPQLPWQNAAAWDGSGGRDNYNVAMYRKEGLTRGGPVAMARCGGRVGFCALGLIAFQDGLIGTAGSNTANNRATLQLPRGKVPTAVAITNGSEFALVTVWDTEQLKGQVAVIALAGLCNGCDPYRPDKPAWYDWWHEWNGVYPGLPNMGNIAFMKLLGFVDLPQMHAPTDIAVTTGFDQFKSVQDNGLFMGRDFSPLTDPAKRRSFSTGGPNAHRYARGGVAVVISKAERKAVFIDLAPLFRYVNDVYFGDGPPVFDRLGAADDQWPHSFAHRAQQRPQVIRTVTLDDRPTAVRTTVFGRVQRAWIATERGSLRIYSLGQPLQGAVPAAQIAEMGRVAIGTNPTSLAISKADPDAPELDVLNRQVLVASRGERKIQWVRFAPDGNSGRVVRTLRDSRIVDPLAVEDADNFANVGHVLSIADHAGAKVSNYRYGPVFLTGGAPWACQPPKGCPVKPTGDQAIEFGGSFMLEGKPFQIRTSNVP